MSLCNRLGHAACDLKAGAVQHDTWTPAPRGRAAAPALRGSLRRLLRPLRRLRRCTRAGIGVARPL